MNDNDRRAIIVHADARELECIAPEHQFKVTKSECRLGKEMGGVPKKKIRSNEGRDIEGSQKVMLLMLR